MKLIYFILCIFIFSQSSAMQVNPSVSELTPYGRNSQTHIRIENTTDSPITIEMLTSRITDIIDGNEIRIEEEDDLLVIPAIALIAPGKSQSLMVRYMGDPELNESRSYRLTIAHLLISNSSIKDKSLNISVNFNALITVTPEQSQSKLKIISFQQRGDSWIAKIENTGNRYARLRKMNWTISQKGTRGTSQVLDKAHLIKGSQGLLLPNSTKLVEILPVPGFDIEKSKLTLTAK